MEDTKRIQFVGMKPTRPLLRFVERQLEKWMCREQAPLDSPKNSAYEVTVEREASYPHYLCDISVRVGSKRWHSFDSGRTLHDALKRALEHLRFERRFQ